MKQRKENKMAVGINSSPKQKTKCHVPQLNDNNVTQ